jgi:LAO/AO transport system kinase
LSVAESASGLYEKLLGGDRRAAARLISMVERGDIAARAVLKMLYAHTGNAHIIGLTGPPGSGKSTLAGRLAGEYLRKGQSVGIVCVDPTSPFTGGALLGDRVRMQELSADPEVFIRSMGTRGAMGGLSVATNDVIDILDAFGKDYIIVETVGAGQVEIEVVQYVHTSVVVTMPGAGDEIQAIKAGILEIGDVFVVNKSDRQGTQSAVADLEMMIETAPGGDEVCWKPPVMCTAAASGEGVEELIETIEQHADYLRMTGLLEQKTEQRMKAELLNILDLRVSLAARKALDEEVAGKELVRMMVARQVDPYSAADVMVAYLLERAGGEEL